LAAVIGMGVRSVGHLTTRSYGFDGDRLRQLGPGEAALFLGFQVPKSELGRGIRAFSDGMAELVDGLVRALPSSVTIHAGQRVLALERSSEAVTLRVASGDRVIADRVVVATAARAAADLLAPLAGEAVLLAGAPVVSSVTVSLAYRRDRVGHPLDGTGFVVAEDARISGLRACTFTSSKLPARAPDGCVLLRAFFRPSDDELDRLDDLSWSRRAAHALASILTISATPEHAWVTRWPRALPVHDEAHRERVERVERALVAHRVVLAGSAFHGAGIDAALRSADRAVEALG
jgi:oxygen-dependent protoporphyrinogen oxidase